MEPLDDDLKLALRRRDPGPWFTHRVLEAVRAEPKPSRRPNWVLVGTIAACLTVGLFVRNSFRHTQIPPPASAELSAEQAEAELMLALHIAGSKVEKARLAVVGDSGGFE